MGMVVFDLLVVFVFGGLAVWPATWSLRFCSQVNVLEQPASVHVNEMGYIFGEFTARPCTDTMCLLAWWAVL